MERSSTSHHVFCSLGGFPSNGTSASFGSGWFENASCAGRGVKYLHGDGVFESYGDYRCGIDNTDGYQFTDVIPIVNINVIIKSGLNLVQVETYRA